MYKKNTSNSNMAPPTDTTREMYHQHHDFFVLPLLLSRVYFNNYFVESFCSAPQEELIVKNVENLTKLTTYEHTRDQRWCLGDSFITDALTISLSLASTLIVDANNGLVFCLNSQNCSRVHFRLDLI